MIIISESARRRAGPPQAEKPESSNFRQLKKYWAPVFTGETILRDHEI